MTIDRRSFLVISAAVAAGAAFPAAASVRRRNRVAESILPWDALREDGKRGVWASAGDVPGGNVAIVTDGAGEALIIDAKFASLGGAIREDAKSLASAASITFVNTHHHGDHTGGNPAIVEVAAKRYAHEKLSGRVTAQLDSLRQQASAAAAQAGRMDAALNHDALLELAGRMTDRAETLDAAAFLPTVQIGDEPRNIHVGAIEASLEHFGPGHTDNDLTVHIPSMNVLHTGDLVFSGLHPFFDPDGGSTVFGWMESLQQVRKLCDDETVVIPGHGKVGDRSIIDAQLQYHERLLAAVQAEMKKGTPKDELTAMKFDFFEGLGFEQIAGRAIGAVYDELEKNGNG